MAEHKREDIAEIEEFLSNLGYTVHATNGNNTWFSFSPTDMGAEMIPGVTLTINKQGQPMMEFNKIYTKFVKLSSGEFQLVDFGKARERFEHFKNMMMCLRDFEVKV